MMIRQIFLGLPHRHLRQLHPDPGHVDFFLARPGFG
ncbi:MAG: hypothetical protein BWY71_01862 [Planctomycetes bacterium ADurb.Bin412]|nr:MAG: hypothetical protein BWY71_01862 [Planctomycetes bacterium ADurb.Bin412]